MQSRSHWSPLTFPAVAGDFADNRLTSFGMPPAAIFQQEAQKGAHSLYVYVIANGSPLPFIAQQARIYQNHKIGRQCIGPHVKSIGNVSRRHPLHPLCYEQAEDFQAGLLAQG